MASCFLLGKGRRKGGYLAEALATLPTALTASTDEDMVMRERQEEGRRRKERGTSSFVLRPRFVGNR